MSPRAYALRPSWYAALTSTLLSGFGSSLGLGSGLGLSGFFGSVRAIFCGVFFGSGFLASGFGVSCLVTFGSGFFGSGFFGSGFFGSGLLGPGLVLATAHLLASAPALLPA